MVKGNSLAVDRATPKQMRTRTCNNPAPLNGGAECEGADEEYRNCHHPCTIDGAWSGWTQWSDCNDKCVRVRKRKCNAPSPLNGGTYCQGTDFETVNCTEGPSVPIHCTYPNHITNSNVIKDQLLNGNELPRTNTESVFVQNPILLFASLGCVAILLLIILALTTILVCRRKRAKVNSSFYGNHSKLIV